MGIRPDDFWDMTPREFMASCHGYGKRVEAEQRLAVDTARMTARAVVQIWSKKAVKLSHIAEMPWDTDKLKASTTGGFVSYEQAQGMLNLLSKHGKPT
jgi:hypothetical protein